MKKHIRFSLLIIGVVLSYANIFSFAEILEHPIIKPIPKSILEDSSHHKDYTYEFPFYDKKANVLDYKKIKGVLWKLSYNIFGKDNQRNDGVFTSIEIIRTYRNFVLEKGGEILWERAEGGRLTFTIQNSSGYNTWCHVSARNGYYELDIVEQEAKDEKSPNMLMK